MSKKCFVTTDPQAGWDCVGSVFYADSIEEVEKYLKSEYGEGWEHDRLIHEIYSTIEL